jgi:hypothetical protein
MYQIIEATIIAFFEFDYKPGEIWIFVLLQFFLKRA